MKADCLEWRKKRYKALRLSLLNQYHNNRQSDNNSVASRMSTEQLIETTVNNEPIDYPRELFIKEYGITRKQKGISPLAIELTNQTIEQYLHENENYAFYALDFTSAYQTLNRSEILIQTLLNKRNMYNYVKSLIGKKSILVLQENNLLESAQGIKQGNCFSPLLFCQTTAPILKEIQQIEGVALHVDI